MTDFHAAQTVKSAHTPCGDPWTVARYCLGLLFAALMMSPTPAEAGKNILRINHQQKRAVLKVELKDGLPKSATQANPAHFNVELHCRKSGYRPWRLGMKSYPAKPNANPVAKGRHKVQTDKMNALKKKAKQLCHQYWHQHRKQVTGKKGIVKKLHLQGEHLIHAYCFKVKGQMFGALSTNHSKRKKGIVDVLCRFQ